MRETISGATRRFRRIIGLAGVAFALGVGSAAASDVTYGAFGPEGTRLREQLWIVPGGDAAVPLRATVFRPAATRDEPPRRPLAVINHGSDDATRVSVSMPVFYWLSKWFVERGYVVLLPQRRGHGATGGPFVEGRDSCGDPDHKAAGQAAAEDIGGALRYMAEQPFVDPTQTVVVGVSTGGWGALALAAQNPPGVRMIVNFAGGRGAYAYGQPGVVCGAQRLIDAASVFGHASQIPTLWFYSRNDSYFGPELATSMAGAWQKAGGRADLRLVRPYGAEGHDLASDRAGWQIWGADLDEALKAPANVQLRVSVTR